MRALELIESDIHEHPGLEGFQKPLTEEDLISLASEGPVLCFITNTAGSFLIAVSQNGITAQRLDGLSESTLRRDLQVVTKLRPAVETLLNFRSRNEGLKRVFNGLWIQVVRPALDRLELLRKPADGSTPPRVWWTTSDLVGLLPIHAAGQFHFGDD